MANARYASLLAQRNPYGKIKILAPANTSIASIAKSSAASEVSAMVNKYNAGEIGNQEMLDFLTSQLTNTYLSDSAIVDIQDQIRNFSSLVQKDQLEAAFKSAPDNSLAQIQAARALSQYYATRASAMAPGTPAQSQALSNKAQWDGTITTITQNMNKIQLDNIEQTKLYQINQMPTSSSQRSLAIADMYKQLTDTATAQGDSATAQVYAAKQQQALTMASQYQDAEIAQAGKDQRKQVIDAMNQAKNDYHDGKITADQYYQILTAVNDYAVQNSDPTLQNSVNAETDRVAKIEAKGGQNFGTAGGLPVVLKGYGGGGGGPQTNYDKNAYDYSENLRLAQEMLTAGKDGAGNPYTSEMYQQDIVRSIIEYNAVLQNEIATMETVAQTNPDQKVYFEGKKQRVADVVDQLYKAVDQINPQVAAIQNGNFAIMEVPPKESSTNPNGKPVTTYEIVDKNNIDPNTTATDASGIIHQILKTSVPMTLDQVRNVSNGVYYDPATGQSFKAFQDPAGNWRMYTAGQYVDIYEPGGTQKFTTQLSGDKNQYIPSYQENKVGMELTPNQAHVEGAQAEAMMAKAKRIQSQQASAVPATGVVPQQPKPITISSQTPGMKVETPVPVPVGTPTPTLPKPVVIQPQTTTVSQQTAGSTPGLRVDYTPSSSSGGVASPKPVVPSLNIQKPQQISLTQSNGQILPGLRVDYTPPKVPAPVKAPTAGPNLGTILSGGIGQGINKLRSLFKF